MLKYIIERGDKMKTLDSLPREDLLKTLKNMILVHTGVEGNKQARKESQNRIEESQLKLKKTGRALRVCGYVNLVCLIIAILFVLGDTAELYWLPIGIGVSIIVSALGWHGIKFTKSRIIKSIVVLFILATVVALFQIGGALEADHKLINFIGVQIYRRNLDGPYRQEYDMTRFLVWNALLLVAIIGAVVYGYMRKAKYKKGEFAKATKEEQSLIDEYTQKIDEYNDILAGGYEAYCVRKDLQSAAALRFCYDEIYSSSRIDINEALQHYLEKKHRDRMARLKQQQIDEIRRASEQAHDDAMAMQQAQASASHQQQSAQQEANATLTRMENDQWFNRR